MCKKEKKGENIGGFGASEDMMERLLKGKKRLKNVIAKNLRILRRKKKD